VTLGVREDPEAAVMPVPGPARPRWRVILARTTTALAILLVLFALLGPDRLTGFTPALFLRIPVEALLGAALLLLLPPVPRRVVAVLFGVLLAVLAVWKLVDMGFFTVLARPFDPVADWILLTAFYGFLTDAMGRSGAIATAIGIGVLAVALLVLMPLAVLRLTRLAVRHQTATAHTVAALSVAWVACTLLGVQIVPGAPVAAHSSGRVDQVRDSLQDPQRFAAELAVDDFRYTPGEELLTGLRGKDVILAFVESYGRSAVEDPELSPQVGVLLDAGTARLREAGFSSRSAYLTSPTVGGASWLAHATLLSGRWVDSQRRYEQLVASDRPTLNQLFHRAGWRTLAIVPGVTQEWGEAPFFGYDRIYDAHQLGYQGPRFSWARMPDQYTLAAFERLERGSADRGSVMAEIPLVSSHAPWTPIPRPVAWDEIGDGTIFGSQDTDGLPPEQVLGDPSLASDLYGRAVEYTVGTLISYVETYGDEDLVLIFLGDHQPAPLVTGVGASRDVPVTIVAGDPAVLQQISSWGWQDGLRPGPEAPVWPMDAFRDRFLTAFG
jgi:hypothetical protein